MGSNTRGSPSHEKDQNINDDDDDIYGNKGYDEGYSYGEYEDDEHYDQDGNGRYGGDEDFL